MNLLMLPRRILIKTGCCTSFFDLYLMDEWTSEFIQAAQGELTSMVSDWKYDYGVDDLECSTMLLWMAVRLNPGLATKLDLHSFDVGI